MIGRATSYYQRALPALEGLEKVRMEKALKTLAESQAHGASSVVGVVQPGNVALAVRGTRVEGALRAEQLLDGNSKRYTGNEGYAYGQIPCEWTIIFPQTYR